MHFPQQAMHAPAAGVAYSLWLRLRWVMAGIFAYMAILAVIVQLYPRPQSAAGAYPLCAVFAHLLTVFTLGPVDLGARGSGFPKSMFVLPLRTRSLVCWPMIYGTVSVAALWVLVTTLILNPAGLNTPVLWPAAVAAAAIAWLQAIGWSPFPSPFARVPALALALTPLSLVVTCAYMYLDVSRVSIAIVAASLVWTLLAYFFAIQGLSRARAGSDGEWLRTLVARIIARHQKLRRPAIDKRPHFRSALRAQLWHEFRRNAIALPLMLGFISLPMMALILPASIDSDASRNLMFNSVTLSPPMIGLVMLIGLFILLSGLYGASMGKFDIWGKEQMPGFFAIRPMTTPRFVLVKMVGAALGSLFSWGWFLVLLLTWAAVEASPLNVNESVVRSALAQATPREVAIFGLALVGLLATSCRDLVIGMWTTLLGRKWIAMAIGFVFMALFGLAALAGQWFYRHPEFVPDLLTYLPWLLGIALLIKLLVGGWIIRELRRLRLASHQEIRLTLGIWAAACVALFAIVTCLANITPTIALSIVLAVPLARIVAAPLALHRNRHR
jgi:hypothetical protein